MSRRRRRVRRPAPDGAARRDVSRHKWRFPQRVIWILAALAVAGALLWSPARRLLGRAPVPPNATPAPDLPAGVSAESALDSALALVRSGHDIESLPYFRHAISGARVASWEVHYGYGTALYNATLLIRRGGQFPTCAVRSSWERITLIREAIQELALAGQLARTPRDRAVVQSTFAQMAWVWGLPWDAFVAFRQAQYANPEDRTIGLRADGLMDLIRAPTTSRVTVPDASIMERP